MEMQAESVSSVINHACNASITLIVLVVNKAFFFIKHIVWNIALGICGVFLIIELARIFVIYNLEIVVTECAY